MLAAPRGSGADRLGFKPAAVPEIHEKDGWNRRGAATRHPISCLSQQLRGGGEAAAYQSFPNENTPVPTGRAAPPKYNHRYEPPPLNTQK